MEFALKRTSTLDPLRDYAQQLVAARLRTTTSIVHELARYMASYRALLRHVIDHTPTRG
jgi:hypothetical protein